MDIEAQGELEQVRGQVRIELASYLTSQRAYLSSIGSELIVVCDALDEFVLDGGKRLRPLFAYTGFCATGKVATEKDIRAFASLELLQACALIHDDLIDGSDTRRGKPAMHRRFENLHQEHAMSGLAQQFGESAAVLLGDLALVWSDHMLHSSAISQSSLISALFIHDEMRIELMAGQYLDIRESGEKYPSVERSLRIARYKSGKYTIERPLHFGAAIARTDVIERAGLMSALSDYGLPLGEAFQLRDDLLGVFGDLEVTGKPAGDDIREGKRTVLMALTMERATAIQRREIDRFLGKDDLMSNEIDAVRSIITEVGAAEHTEALIRELTSKALDILGSAEIAPTSKRLFSHLASIATSRSN